MKEIKKVLLIMIILLLNQSNEQENTDANNTGVFTDIKCGTRNCVSCNKKSECIKCKPNYVLFNKRCYLDQCELYGECSYCTEYDCVQCNHGFKVSYGFCEEISFFNKHNLIIIISSAIGLITLVIIASFIYIKKKRKGREFISPHQLTSKLSNGQYIIINPQNNNFIFNSVTNPNNQSMCANSVHSMKGSDKGLNDVEMITNNTISMINSSKANNKAKVFLHLNDISLNDSQSKRMRPLNICIICHSNKLYSFASCGCGLCYKDFNNIVKKKKKYICFLHKTFIQEGYLFMKEKQEMIPSIDEEEEDDTKKNKDEGVCPICKISPGVYGFNCGCPILLCAKCFNDNMNMFKIRKCPGCKKTYKEIQN